MVDTSLLDRPQGTGRGTRYRIGVDTLSSTTVRGRERVFLLDQFLESASASPVNAATESGMWPSDIDVDNIVHSSMMNESMGTGLLRIPPDVLYRICSMLPWASQELLSRTCTVLRQRLHPPCTAAVRNMSRYQFLHYQTDLAQTMPEHVVCTECFRLHRAVVGDFPAEAGPVRKLCAANGNSGSTNSQVALSPGYGYRLRHHHVQLALKFCRLGLHCSYVDDMLQPYRACSSGLGTRVAIQVLVRPVLTLHEPRPSFLLFRKMEFSQHLGEDAQPLEAASIQHLFVCPHASLAEYDPTDMQCEILYDSVDNASLGLHTRRNFSCKRCPTDVCIDTQPGRLFVRVWHDFGPEGTSPTDDAWLVHVGGRKNNEFVGPSVYHMRGSVRARYEHAVRLQMPRKAIVQAPEHRLTSFELGEAAMASVLNRLNGRDELEGICSDED